MDSENKYFIQKTENRIQTTDLATRPLSSVLCPLEVGFPIRKFTDQSLFAAPHDLSQRTTSFIASQRQGIHQIPLRHLIALIAKARFVCKPSIGNRKRTHPGVEKTSFASSASGDLSGQAPDPRLVLTGRRKAEDRGQIVCPRSPLPASVTECASSSQCQRPEDRRQTTEDGSPHRPRRSSF